jgi:hypothetical protein
LIPTVLLLLYDFLSFNLTKKQDPNLDPLVRGTVWIRGSGILTKIAWIRTWKKPLLHDLFIAHNNAMLLCIAAAWKIIKGWLPAAGVKKIRFLTKATMGEYVDDQNRFEVSKHKFTVSCFPKPMFFASFVAFFGV